MVGAYSGVFIVLTALLMGGATALWAQIITAFALGLLWLFFPGRERLGIAPLMIGALLIALAAAAFLPNHWLGMPAWKKHLADVVLIPLGPTRTPQPALTAEALALFALGLVWTLWTLSFDWGRRQRVKVCRALVIGVAVLSGIAVYCYYTGAHFPLWAQAENRGFFPNRNQMANVLALCGLLNYALLYEGLRRRQWWSFAWLLPLGIIGAGLVVAYSRAGIILSFTGIILWHLGTLKRHRSMEKAAVFVSATVVLFALFLIFGGTTATRFIDPAGAPGTPTMLEDYRVVIQHDALQFSLQSPWLGVGLGNFSPLFAMERHRSADPNTTLHPESDWLWVACELGWPAVILLLIALGWWLGQCLRAPSGKEEWHALRLAAGLGVILFVLHALVDVAGHRLGSALFAMLLAGIAMPTRENAPARAWPFRRLLALLPLVIGSWWLLSLRGAERWPTRATLAAHQAALDAAWDADDFDTISKEATAALAIAPLDSQLYFRRGYAQAALGGDVQSIFNDFQSARTLLPIISSICFEEGTVWLSAGYADLALEAWTEALRRSGAAMPDVFRQMLDISRDAPAIRSELRDAALANPALLLIFLQAATPEEASSDIASYLVDEPELAPLNEAQRQQFLVLWWQKGNRESLWRALDQHEDWNSTMWSYRAEALAAQNDFEAAWRLVHANATAPALPQFRPSQPLPDLLHDFITRPNDFTAGYSVYLAQMDAQAESDALFTLRKLTALPNRPAYIFWLQAELYASQRDWPHAWSAWQQYRSLAR